MLLYRFSILVFMDGKTTHYKCEMPWNYLILQMNWIVLTMTGQSKTVPLSMLQIYPHPLHPSKDKFPHLLAQNQVYSPQ